MLIAHAENDWDIPDSHSDVLFNAFLDRVLPKVEVPGNALTATKEEYKAMSSSIKKRQAAKENWFIKSIFLDSAIQKVFGMKRGNEM